MQDDEMPPRGIPNVSGVACHLSSALQLLLHTVPALRMALLEISDPTTIEEWLKELVFLTRSLFLKEEEDVNPMPLYTALSQTTRLDPQKLGDAATALRVLLRTLQQEQDLLCPIIRSTLMNGKVQQILLGECLQNDRKIRRIKETTKPMPCPFPLDGSSQNVTTLPQALEKATKQPQSIEGLDWNQVRDYRQEPKDDYCCVDDDCHFVTTRTCHVSSLPLHFVLHLQRFRYQNDTVEISTNPMDVPRELDMTPYTTNTLAETIDSCCCACRLYQFAGAILYVSDDNEEEEGGHYLALIQSLGGSHCWYLLDDETVTCLPDEEQVMDFVSGRPIDIELEGTCYCATILVYSKTCDCSDSATTQVLDDLRARLQHDAAKQHDECSAQETTTRPTTTHDWSQPNALIGRRLQIRWKSGKYYPGVVSSYDNESGKHCITYDDGDVRTYNLSKKTIEWIDDTSNSQA